MTTWFQFSNCTTLWSLNYLLRCSELLLEPQSVLFYGPYLWLLINFMLDPWVAKILLTKKNTRILYSMQFGPTHIFIYQMMKSKKILHGFTTVRCSMDSKPSASCYQGSYKTHLISTLILVLLCAEATVFEDHLMCIWNLNGNLFNGKWFKTVRNHFWGEFFVF